ncbi:MAG: DsbA family protein [Alphaproteobacteria bacterium]|nr:DsbA family protein [Alphaproteobacteria bacterium]
MNIVKRISRILALCAVYIVCAYSYLMAKGFVFTGETMILSNQAYAKDDGKFAHEVTGDIVLSKEMMRPLGNDNAPLTIYAYSSMACSHCRDFHKFILPKIKRDFIKTGKVRFVFVHFPLEATSMRAAKLSYCLPEDKFEAFITELYDNKDWLFSKDGATLNKYAKDFGMTEKALVACADNKKLTSDILLSRDTAIKSFGIEGTPSFIVDGFGKKELIVGSQSYDELKEYLESRLEGKK